MFSSNLELNNSIQMWILIGFVSDIHYVFSTAVFPPPPCWVVKSITSTSSWEGPGPPGAGSTRFVFLFWFFFASPVSLTSPAMGESSNGSSNWSLTWYVLLPFPFLFSSFAARSYYLLIMSTFWKSFQNMNTINCMLMTAAGQQHLLILLHVSHLALCRMLLAHENT